MLELDHVNVGYGKSLVLHSVSMRVEPGQIVAVVGANGAGKSTLLRTIAGTLTAKSGTISYKGKILNQASPSTVRHCGIGHSPEGRQIFASLSVYDNLILGTYTVDRNKRKEILEQQLALVYGLFPVLKEMASRPAGLLSGGQQQMLSIGRAIMCKPSLILLDEPSMGIAPVLVNTIIEAVKALSKQGVSVLLVEQVVGLALSVSQNAYVLRSGRVVVSGMSSELIQNADKLHHAYFGLTS
jgi:branched-chain amino acid transport system ATP-binding protein